VLDEAARGLLLQKLQDRVPTTARDQAKWFEPYLEKVDSRMHRHYTELARNLRKTLVYQTGVSPLGLLRNCYDYALNDSTVLTGVFDAVRVEFRQPGARSVFEAVRSVNEFRNTRVAHQEKPLADAVEAKAQLQTWVEALTKLWIEHSDAHYAKRCSVSVESITPKEHAANTFEIVIAGRLVDINLGPPGKLPTEFAKRIGDEIVRQVKPVVDFRFGANRFTVACLDLRAGSLDYTVIATVVGTTYLFVKDYDKLRANATVLAADIQRVSGRIKRAVDGLLDDSVNSGHKQSAVTPEDRPAKGSG